MMYWMAMSGSNEPVCGSAVSLAEPPTMPTMRSPPLFGVPAAEAEGSVLVVVPAAGRRQRPEGGERADGGGPLQHLAAGDPRAVDEAGDVPDLVP